VYSDTNAAYIGDEYEDLSKPPTIYCNIQTSSTYLADTQSNIYVTFVGSFSSSGPHQIGPFAVGEASTISIPLTRVIGSLHSATFQTVSSDGWLLNDLKCRISSTWYNFESSSFWLEALDPVKATNPTMSNVYGDQLSDRQGTVVARSNFEVLVTTSYSNFNSIGLDS
jgi:hypothetical protein